MEGHRRVQRPREKNYTSRCAWCDEHFEHQQETATTCSGKCRQRLKRYRDYFGFEPTEPPGKISVQDAIAEVVADLVARERLRRTRESYIESLPSWKRPPGG